jgi:hypothetical protein
VYFNKLNLKLGFKGAVEAKIAQFSRKWLSLLLNGVIGAAALAGVITMQSIGLPCLLPVSSKPPSKKPCG